MPNNRKQELHDCVYIDAPVAVDPPIVTSRGPGTALLFGLTLVAALVGTAKALDLAVKMLISVPETVQREWARFESETS